MKIKTADQPSPPPPPDHFNMATARQMALDALRAWQERVTMPGTSDTDD
jgi:hypothetical protein